VQKVRDAAARMSCSNNLKQIGLATYQYENVAGRFPNSNTFAPAPLAGWTVLILPYLEQENIRNRYDFTANWYDPNNEVPRRATIKSFVCPSGNAGRLGSSSIAAASGTQSIEGGVWDYTNISVIGQPLMAYLGYPNPSGYGEAWFGIINSRGSSLAQIADGLSNTLMVSEDVNRPEYWVKGKRVMDRVPISFVGGGPGVVIGGVWSDHAKGFGVEGTSADGFDVTGECAINCNNSYEIYSFHSGGANGGFADGSVRFLRESINIRTLAAMCTRGAGDIIGDE